MKVPTGSGLNGPSMIKKLQRVVLGLTVWSAPLSANLCLAQATPGTTPGATANRKPVQRAPQAFLLQDSGTIETVPILQAVGPSVPGVTAGSGVQNPVSDENLRSSLRGVVLQSSKLTKEGLDLASKGAAYSARGKFLAALELIADALDARHNTQFHSRALGAGATALCEADDFGHGNLSAAAEADPVALSAGQVTPLL